MPIYLLQALCRYRQEAVRRRVAASLIGALLTIGAATPPLAQETDEAPPERIDYLTFAQGAVPIAIAGTGAQLGADYEAAIRMVDGEAGMFGFVERAPEDAATEFVYELPALTTFDRFAIPNIRETPSPGSTFAGNVQVLGSSTGADGDYTLLAEGRLVTHDSRDEVTELPIIASPAVQHIRLRLTGGIEVLQTNSFFEFSEIIGNGQQDTVALSSAFGGAWRRSALALRLSQDGPVVSGCYDSDGQLSGTVTGNILRATGETAAGIPSAFVLSVAENGAIRGVRSTNGGPFRYYEVAAVEASDRRLCGAPPAPSLGCGSVLHGIGFGYDSAEILPQSDAVLAALFEGLAAEAAAGIRVEGHTSSEGSESYNQQLSERRAAAVVADLVARGLAADRIVAAGIGEVQPIASNADEAGRSLNRRVEVHCT